MPHLKQVLSYSIHRGYFAKKYSRTSLKLKYFIPTLFVLGLIFGIPFSFYNNYIKMTYFVVVSVYTALLILSSLKTQNPLMWLSIFFGIFLTHMAYGIGFVIGLLKPKLIR